VSTLKDLPYSSRGYLLHFRCLSSLVSLSLLYPKIHMLVQLGSYFERPVTLFTRLSTTPRSASLPLSSPLSSSLLSSNLTSRAELPRLQSAYSQLAFGANQPSGIWTSQNDSTLLCLIWRQIFQLSVWHYRGTRQCDLRHWANKERTSVGPKALH